MAITGISIACSAPRASSPADVPSSLSELTHQLQGGAGQPLFRLRDRVLE
jgi:hypothetical protein